MRNPFEHQIVRYGLVGVGNVALDYAVLNLFFLGLHVPLSVAVFAGFLAANSMSYFLHSRWTFRYDTSGKEAQKVSHFFLVGAISLIITEGTVHLLTYHFGLYYNIAKAVAVVLSALWAYAATRWWVFRQA